MASLGALVIELAANTARLQGDLGKAVGMAERAASQFKRAFGGLAAGVGGIGLASLAGKAIELGDSLQKGAMRAGISAGEFSKLAAAAQQTDVDIGTLSRGLKEMQKTISEAAGGNKAAIDSLAALGLNVERLRQLSPQKQLEAIADGLNSITDPADRSRRGAEILGKAYLDLVPALQGGSAALRELVAEQEKLGNTFSDEQIARLADADDAIKRLKASWQGLATTLTAAVAPALTDFMSRIESLVSGRGLDTLEEKLQHLRDERNSFIPIYLNFGYVDGAGHVLGPSELDRQIAMLQKRVDEAALQRRVKAVSRGSGYAGQVAEESRKAAVAADELAKAAKERARQQEAEAKAARDAAITRNAAAWDNMDVSLQTRAEGLLDNFKLESFENGLSNIAVVAEKTFSEFSAYADQAARNMQDAFADFLFDPFQDGLKGMLKGFLDVIRRMVAEQAAAKIFGSKSSGGLGLGGLITGAIGALFGGGGKTPSGGGISNFSGPRALGGPVDMGRSYLVGERGPELFTPGRSGMITPNAGERRALTVHVTNNVNAAQLTQDQAARMVADSQRMMWDEMDRRYGIA